MGRRPPRIAPSILSADFANLAAAVDGVRDEADLLHVDVMDAHFVPNLTIGPPVVAALRRHTDLYLDCHLMMDNPGDFLDAFHAAGANGCSVHVEVGDTGKLIQQMADMGLDPAVAVNPDTPFDAFAEWLDRIRLVLLMTVHPGFAGQTFISDVMDKVRRTRDEIDRRGLDTVIQVDGGINAETAAVASAAGADVFVAGNAIFNTEAPLEAAARIRASAAAAAHQ